MINIKIEKLGKNPKLITIPKGEGLGKTWEERAFKNRTKWKYRIERRKKWEERGMLFLRIKGRFFRKYKGIGEKVWRAAIYKGRNIQK